MSKPGLPRGMLRLCSHALLIVCCSMLVALPLAAQEESEPLGHRGWSVKLRETHPTVSGNSNGEATVVTVSGGEGGPVTDRSDVPVDLDGDWAPRLEIERMGEKWGVVGRGWFYDGADGENIVTMFSDPSNGSLTLLDSLTVGLVPAPPEGSAGNQFITTTHITMGSIEVQAVRRIRDEQDRFFDFQVGLKYGSINDDKNSRLSFNGSEITGTEFGRFHFSEADSDLLLGPVVGARSAFRRGKHVFSGFFNLSFLFGDVKYHARFDGTDPLTGFETVFNESRSETVPITAGELLWTFQLTKNISLGAGLHGEIWFDMPVAPIGETPGNSQPLLLSEDISLFGPVGFFEWRF